MTAKEKALEIVNKYKQYLEDTDAHCALGIEIDLALIAVDEIISNYYDFHYESIGHYDFKEIRDFYNKVKQEIENYDRSKS